MERRTAEQLAALLAAAPESASARLVVDAEREALEGILCYLYTDELPPDAPTEQVLRLRLQVASQAPAANCVPRCLAPSRPRRRRRGCADRRKSGSSRSSTRAARAPSPPRSP